MRAIVSVIGKDRTGIIAKVTMRLFELGCNVEDISQTVMHGSYFTMIMLIIMTTRDTTTRTRCLPAGAWRRRGATAPKSCSRCWRSWKALRNTA